MQNPRTSALETSRATLGQPRADFGWALAPLGALMIIGFIGANLIAVGALQLLQGETNALYATALVIVGGAATTLAWRRGNRVIAATDAPVAG
jgi:hypothetical protein